MNYFFDMRRIGVLGGLFVSLLLLGCGSSGPATGQVEGTITLNGAPLPNAEVAFYPQSGRASQGVTDNDGRYSLMFTYEVPGCLPGEHEVIITTHRPESNEQGAAMLPELVPKKYRKRGDLKATVTPGPNVINFDLTK